VSDSLHKGGSKSLLKLGISNFETVRRTRNRQADMLRRMRDAGIDRGYYVGLADCTPGGCGRRNCAEACWFGARRRRLEEIPAVVQLFQKAKGPICEVRIVRESWQRPAGQLEEFSIAAAKQFHRRVLDKLYIPSLVAVGMCKVSFGTTTAERQWITEIHGIIAGAEKEELEKVFSVYRRIPGMEYNLFWAKEVRNIGPTVNRILKRDLRKWVHPFVGAFDPGPGKARRAEFDRWLLGLDRGDRLIRYGCDRNFNALNKKPRIYRPKIHKKRPYPAHLEAYWFGHQPPGHAQNCTCSRCSRPE
jgi:hypothetical protein